MRILGIDPGVSGAAALYWPEQSVKSGLRWVVIDLPVIGKRPEINAPVLRDWIMRHCPDHAYIEQVNAMPSIPGADGKRRGMGATSAFRFGGTYFSLKAIVACCDVPTTTAPPQSWKKVFNLMKSDKERSRQRALELFPDQSAVLARKKDQNRAEAMLLAAYGARILGAAAPKDTIVATAGTQGI